MASTLSYTYTGSYNSSTRSITAWIRYTFNAEYSDTQSQLIIHSMGVRNNSSSAMEWGNSSTNGPKYISVTPAGQSQYKVDRTSTDFKWAGGNYDYWNFVTNGRNASISAWDANAPKYYYFNRSTSAQSIKLTGHIYKKGAWAVNTDFSTTLTVPAYTYTVSFDANGGTGAPAAQKKTYGVALTLSGTVPTRSGYDFLGWGTSAQDTLPAYRYGPNHDVATTFTTNENTSLYAVWHPSFTSPKIEGLRAYRVASNASGYDPAVFTSGTKGYADFVYTAPTNYNTVSLAIKFGSASITPTSSGSNRYAYTNASIPANSAVDVSVIISGTKYTYVIGGVTYGGEAFSTTAGSFISKEAYVWDAYKDTSGYQAFAVGQLARESDDQYESTEPTAIEGDMDVFFRASFINDVFLYIDENASSGVDYEILQGLIALGWTDDVIQ